uniref:Uncharacterized protein n=1 Tax=Wuchereria bancrofti TaxID=6293 RepID=A0A1I8EAS0_WUCBA
METSTTIVHEASSAFDPDREMKDRKLAQIFKKLHMEQDLNTLLDFDAPRPSKASSNHTEELSKDKTERCRPRKILDYAVLAKGQSYRNNLVGSFASNYSETGGSNKSGAGSKRIRFQKDRFGDNIPTLSAKRRSRCGRYASTQKSNKSQRFSFPSATNGVRKKEKPRSQSFTYGIKRGILKKRTKDVSNIKQAFAISKKVLDAQNQHFDEFILPEKWIKESQKRKNVKKIKTAREESTSSASVEDLAMERLVRAFKTAKLLYPEKFAEYFPDFVHCFESDDNREKRGMPKQTNLKTIKSEQDVMTFDKNSASHSGDDVPKRIRKVPKILRDYSTGAEIARKKLASLKEQIPSVTQKISRIGGPLAGTSGLRKRSRASDSPSNQSMLSKSQENGKIEDAKERDDSEEMGRVAISKKRKSYKSLSASIMKATNTATIQNNIEDSATESSSDESGNMRSSKRQRAQSGFYKTMVTLYDKRRS